LTTWLATAEPMPITDGPANGGALPGVLTAVLLLGLVVVGLAMAMCLWRIARGPGMADRVMAVDTLGIELIGFIILMALLFGSTFIDAVLVLSLLGFVGTLAMGRFIMRRERRTKGGLLVIRGSDPQTPGPTGPGPEATQLGAPSTEPPAPTSEPPAPTSEPQGDERV
jgi:multisubunit Na+/H+ antiporter MnhF subunit